MHELTKIIKTILVVGLGSIGKRHLANLKIIYPDATYVILRHAAPLLDSKVNQVVRDVTNNLDAHLVYNLSDALSYCPEIAIICSPASDHLRVATILATNGVHLFIEKPISDQLVGVDELIFLCEQKKLVLMIGYTLRFLPSLRQLDAALRQDQIGKVYYVQAMVGQYLPDWRPNIDYRKSVTAQKKLGGGVLLELSHEIDYLLWLFGEVCAVQGWAHQLSDLEVDVEDSADAILHFKNGIIGNIHMDFFQRQTVRTCRVVGSLGTLLWDGIKHTVTLCYSNQESILFSPQLGHQRNDIYLDQMRHFLARVLSNDTSLASATAAKQTLEVVTAIKEASSTGAMIKL